MAGMGYSSCFIIPMIAVTTNMYHLFVLATAHLITDKCSQDGNDESLKYSIAASLPVVAPTYILAVIWLAGLTLNTISVGWYATHNASKFLLGISAPQSALGVVEMGIMITLCIVHTRTRMAQKSPRVVPDLTI